MNPPFSATAGRLSKMDTRFAKRHIEQALNRLEEGGRLVAIVGRGMSDYAPTFRDWWNDIKKEYNVLANITLDGENYRKHGTTFDINIVVIDKNGPTSNTIVDKVKDLNNLLELLEGVKNVRHKVSKRSEDVKPSTDKPTNTKTTEENRLGDRRRNPIYNTDDRLGSRGEDTKNADNKESRTDSSKTKNVKKTKKDNEDTRGMDRDRGAKTDKKSEGDGSLSDNESSRAGGKSIEVEVKTDKEIKKDNKKSLGDSVFTEYVPQKLKIKGAKKHPGKLTQSAAIGSVEPPDPTYKPSLPKDVIEEGKLSIAQLEAVVYAGQSHEQILPSGERRGFFIGDGTGVGKGREIAGIILDNFNKGRKKAVWISLSQKLYQDAKRDAQSLGMDISKIYNLGKYKMDEDIKLEEGIMYTTYATLRQNLMSAPSGGKEYITSKQGKSRLNQLVRWLGNDFDGVIVFDEAHKMGNASDGEFGKKATKQALAGLELQRLLPKARIVYVSATGATEVENLAYATRLGLWGKGTPFANVNDFISKISAGGLAAMEMVAKDMKAMGVYISRSLSYEGVQYDKLVHKLTDDQKQIYDTMSRAWQIILQNMEKALEATGGNKNSSTRKNARQAFWSSQQRFYNQILTSMQS